MSKVFITTTNGKDHLNIEDAALKYKNFAGRETERNRAGNRNFNVVLDEDVALDLKERGWNVRERHPKNNPEETFYMLPVTVNYNCNYPPRIWRIVDKRKTMLTEANVGVLDMSNIVQANLVINPRYWDSMGASGIKAYLEIAYIEVEEDAFASRYEDLEEIG